MTRRAWIGAVLLAAAGCGGDGVIDMGTGAPPPPPGTPTLSSLQTSIFTPKCALPGCHAGPGPQQGMDLSAGKTFVYTVGVPSVEASPLERISPGDAADSYLYMKVAGDPRIIGERMPFGGDPLSAAELQALHDWIDAGAHDD